METLLYLMLAAMLYAILADRTDQAVEREMARRRERSAGLHLVEDLDDGPARTSRPRAPARLLELSTPNEPAPPA